jgi:signal transduction histidine kinase/ActR/RegA family two-component response regulator
MLAQTIAKPIAPITPDTTGGETYELLTAHPDRLVLAVVENQRPVGLVNRDRFFVQMADRFGRALWEKRPIAQIMNCEPRLVHAETTIQALGAQLLSQRASAITDGFIVVDDAGRYRGVASALDLIIASLSALEGKNTELTTLTDELTATTVEARAANQAKSDFLAMMSHEIRTPLNGVLGMGAVLARTELSDAQREQLDLILSSGRNLNRIIGDILDLSKIEAGRLEIERAEFDPEEMVERACALYAAAARERGVALTREPGAPLPRRCLGDGLRLSQVLNNLISNAVKFTEEGDVVVSARMARDEAGRDALTVAVTDTGVGMTPDQLTSVFDAFAQADVSVTRKFGGTGLGLSISKRLVELMGGAISAKSAKGIGSCFCFRAPIEVQSASATRSRPIAISAPSSSSARSESARAAPRADARLRLLVVEDDPGNQRVMLALLEALGADTTLVSDGRAALDALATAAFHLVLMDVRMPVLDGVEVTRALRTREAVEGLPRTPVIAVTASALPCNAEQCLSVGVDACVAKPIEPVRLYSAINDALHAAKSRAKAA